MTYCIVEDGVIVNLIVCDNPDLAVQLLALPSYPGAVIGADYIPPKSEKTYTADDLFLALLGG